MLTKVGQYNYSFLIETFTDGGDRLLMWRLDQFIANPGREREVIRVTNQVERHLSDLNKRTGLHYSCFAQGPADEMDSCIRSLKLEVH